MTKNCLEIKHLSLATTWDEQLLDGLVENGLTSVRELWGTMTYNPSGSGRGPLTQKITEKVVERHVRSAITRGFSFCYLMNAPCMGNHEYSNGGKNAILKHMEWIVGVGATSLTVSNPFIMELARRHFPQLKIKASVIMEANSVARIRRLFDAGCSIVNLSFDKNRDFTLLESIPDVLRPRIELLTSDVCLFGCAQRTYHYNQVGHASTKSVDGKNTHHEIIPWHRLFYPMISCTVARCAHPEEWIKSRWIRPEDLGEYRERGYHRFKIGTRGKNTPWALNTARAFHAESYCGNLLDLFTGGHFDVPDIPQTPEIWIENRKLDGFLAFFIKNKPNCETDCGISCKHCDAIASKAVSTGSSKIMAKYLKKLKALQDDLSSLP